MHRQCVRRAAILPILLLALTCSHILGSPLPGGDEDLFVEIGRMSIDGAEASTSLESGAERLFTPPISPIHGLVTDPMARQTLGFESLQAHASSVNLESLHVHGARVQKYAQPVAAHPEPARESVEILRSPARLMRFPSSPSRSVAPSRTRVSRFLSYLGGGKGTDKGSTSDK